MSSTLRKLRDPTTLSNYDRWETTRTTVNFDIHFSEKKLSGNVILKLKALGNADGSDGHEIVLDTSNLDIKDVTLDGRPANWTIAPETKPYGSALKIQVGKVVPKDQNVEVDIQMQTTSGCTALQWFDPAQTSNKKHPYMFSQCQAIHARSCLPCQDTPDVKAPFDFNIRSPLPVIASGLSTGVRDFKPGQDGTPGTLLYTFKQEVPIPSYLFAVASGDIAIASIGPRSTVATGPEELRGAKWELEEHTERFIQAAEKILQVVPYAWTTYNVLVLPPSFPYGGMENPVFTFATPTIISGDRESVGVIAHELSHSWSGNLVSNASWEHFWINEGWTVYLERRIIGEIYGEARRSFSAIIGWQALSESVSRFGPDHEFTKMVVDLRGKHTDDAFSTVPYEKGFNFLYYLEHLVGKDKWDKFIPHYFAKFARKSLDSFEFKDTVLSFFADDPQASKLLDEVDWDKWYYSTGMPPKPDFDTSLVDICYALADKWLSASSGSGFEPKSADIEGWTAKQKVVFLERLLSFDQSLTKEEVQTMGKAYGFANSPNVEVVSRYYNVGFKAKDDSVYQPTAELLGKVGRMKFVRPLFIELNEADRDLAVKTFEKNELFYHPICRKMVRQDLFDKK